MTAIEELLINLAYHAASETDSLPRREKLLGLIDRVKTEAAIRPPAGRTFTAEQYHAAFDERGNPRTGA